MQWVSPLPPQFSIHIWQPGKSHISSDCYPTKHYVGCLLVNDAYGFGSSRCILFDERYIAGPDCQRPTPIIIAASSVTAELRVIATGETVQWDCH